MRLRQLVLACGLTSFMLSPYASALGLGEVTLKSSLNQPLEAEVKLLDTRDLTAEQILVALASPADFERNGVDRLYFYTEFQFEVVLDAAGGPKVIITSRSPVREPYLNFLIEARWTAGRLLREYTLLMDLPTFDENGSSQSVQAATQSEPQPQSGAATGSRSTVKRSEPSYQAPRQSVSTSRASLDGDEYEVRQNDTLWDIALRARNDSSVSVHQSMMALYHANPDAFINGNINRLRRGQVLRIPDVEEMKSLGKSEAVSQFAQATGESDSGAQLSASRRTSAPRVEPTEASGRVKLAAPSSGASAGQGSGANDGAGKALESELAVTLEELDKSKAENTELNARVRDLEEQIQTMERLVEVSNEKLRALQVSATKTVEETETLSSVSAEPAPVVAATTPSAVAQSSQSVAPKVVMPSVPAPTLADKAIENAPWIGLGVLGLVGAGLFAYRRRKQAETQQEEQEDVFAMDDSVAEHEEQVFEHEEHHAIDDSSLFDESDQSTAVAETGDVVGEADIYIAYGKLDQAEEMLVNALQKDPESADIRMKLLEVYAQQQNAPAFDKHYAALLPLASAAVLARASELRDGIAGAGEFDAVDASSNMQDDSNDNFLLDDFNLDEEPPQTVVTNTENADFDFSLDFDDHEENLASVQQDDVFAKNTDDPATASLNEFELDLDDDFSLESEPDDLSELSSALDDLNADSLPHDVETVSSSAEEDFSFDLDLNDNPSASSFESNELVLDLEAEGNGAEPLDVVADDFNLDMDVDDVDLAALDHEMQSLDFDVEGFDSDLAGDVFESPEENNEATELNSLVDSSGLDLDDDQSFIAGEFDNLSDDISTANLNLTDDLDKFDQDVMTEAIEDKVDDISIDLSDEFEFDTKEIAEDKSLVELTSNDDVDFAVTEALENEHEEGVDELNSPTDLAFVSSPEVEQPVIDLELQDEIPASHNFIDVDTPIDENVALEEVHNDHEEDLFTQALSDFSAEDDINLNSFSSDETALDDLSDEEMDAELDFLADADEAATKLDLARAYIDMGDADGAKDILSEVLGEGNDEQRKEANELLARIG
ncbi:FimV/HubP family polar landmark protein [Cellvibrio sp. UBA7661]|uniref:FimV/HubP family polar landmark protein n=1 Tax=Cellvibrio sp. UBA7661 TaxID=1946311 RepID=UPI002F360965